MATQMLSSSSATDAHSSRGTSRTNDWKAADEASFADFGAGDPAAAIAPIRSFTSASASPTKTAFALRLQEKPSPAERRSCARSSQSKAMVVIPQ